MKAEDRSSFASFGDPFAILSQADYILLSSFWGLLREDMDLSCGRSGRSPYRIADRCAKLEGHDKAGCGSKKK
ncbi:hypothetical protein J28TS4_06670 [Paenibacillus lautus]|nr:hypothetical protein J28TS4_06670 [Paenibacillus lautus]